MRSLGNIPDNLKDQLAADYRTADISDEDKTILEFVELLTLRPWEVTADTLEPLKALEFDDRMLHDIVQVTAYYAYVNRVADGLGVELDE